MNVLITRPLSQAKVLQSLLKRTDNTPILFPTLKIKPVQARAKFSQYDAVIFISANAVDYGLSTLENVGYSQVFAVGQVTAKRLSEQGIRVDGFPDKNASSEALLALDVVQALQHKHILIFRGKGGTETLKKALNKHNIVEYIEVYQRVQCPITHHHQTALTQFLNHKRGVITITSVENLTNLMSMIDKINTQAILLIKTYPLVVLSQRIKNYAESIGFKRIEIAPQTNDTGLIDAIKRIVKD